MKKPARLNSKVPSGFSKKSITWVPCVYQPMKIRFCPGTCCMTCAVQKVPSGCSVSIGVRKMALSPFAFLA